MEPKIDREALSFLQQAEKSKGKLIMGPASTCRGPLLTQSENVIAPVSKTHRSKPTGSPKMRTKPTLKYLDINYKMRKGRSLQNSSCGDTR
jgi:hypothetical protein